MRLVREDGGRPKFWQVAVRCISLYLILLAAPWAGFGAWNGMIDATGWRFFALGAAAILCLGVFAIFVFTCFINLMTRASRLPHDASAVRNQISLYLICWHPWAGFRLNGMIDGGAFRPANSPGSFARCRTRKSTLFARNGEICDFLIFLSSSRRIMGTSKGAKQK